MVHCLLKIIELLFYVVVYVTGLMSSWVINKFILLHFSRAVHNSAYDKNPDEQIRPSVVPDELIQPQSDKYWAPHPKTGVFGPATESTSAAGGERGLHASSSDGGEGSVLEQKAWFRPTSIEDLEKPHPN